MNTETVNLEGVDELISSATTDIWALVLFNDDFNSFEHIIEKLIQILKISIKEAASFAGEAHVNGRAYIKEGEFEELTALHEEFGKYNITTDVEKI